MCWFCWFIWSARGLNLYALGSQPEKKLEDRKYQIGAGVIAVVITLLVIQMGLTVPQRFPWLPSKIDSMQVDWSALLSFIPPISSSLFHNLWVTAIIGA